ncbi:MAG: carcinine hydrolase/isopenicillin-N N-acyltransferase family protein [Treponema sp.]|nr:carcinine hydrolase/isopenicillin-N N-acyltransferase family protein [Treponema sp.]
MKIFFKIFFRVLGFIGILALLWSWHTYGKFVKAANSVKQLSDHFYYMEFNGNYYLNEFLNKGGADSNKKLAVFIETLLRGKSINQVYKNEVPLNTGCAAISTKNENGEKLFGRNYDWDDFKTGMIIKSNPKKGYKSITTTQIDFLGFGEDFKPTTFAQKYLSSAALFIPLDGMNEKGLCISDLMAGDNEVTAQNNGKADVTTTLAIRGILDFCATVPEAIEFLENHDMFSVIGAAHHFAISDSSRKMVVVEYVDNKMFVTEANAVTNHYLAVERTVKNYENSSYRLEVLNKVLEENKTLSEEDVKQALFDIRAGSFEGNSKTWWRAVFNQDKLTVNYALEENYQEAACLNFKL